MSKLVGVINSGKTINVDVRGIGVKGKDGLSAYELWLQEGHQGTIEDFFAYLGQKGVRTVVHDQIVAKSYWIIKHDLDRHPSVTVVDTGGNVVVGDVHYIDSNHIIIKFTSDFSGKAFLN